MLDFLKQTLEIGDPVIFMNTKYMTLHHGKVKNIGKVRVTIEYDDGETTIRDPFTIIKLPINYVGAEDLVEALCRISLGSQNSATSKEALGKEAREALKQWREITGHE